MNLKLNFFRNIGFGALARVSQMLVGFFVIAYVINIVGIEQWGILTLSVSLISILTLLQVSLSGGTGKRLTDFLVKKDYSGYNQYYSGTLVLVFLLVCLVGLLLFIFSFFLGGIVSESLETLRIIYVLTGINALFHVIGLLPAAILQSINREDIRSKSTTIGFVVRTVLVFSLFYFLQSIVTYVVILLIESVIRITLLYFHAYKNIGIKLSFSKLGLTFSYLKEILTFNYYNFINSLNYLLFLQVPAIIVAKRYGLEFSGYYGIGLQINNLLRGSANIFMSAIAPIFNIINARKDPKLFEHFMLASKFFFMGALSVVTVVWLFAGNLMVLWLDGVTTELITFLKYFSVFIAIGIAFIPSALMLITLEKLKFSSYFGMVNFVFAGIIISNLSNEVNISMMVPIVLSVFYLIYNIQRYLAAINSFDAFITDKYIPLVTLFATIAVLYFIDSNVTMKLPTKLIISFVLIILFSITLFREKDFKYIYMNLLKRNK